MSRNSPSVRTGARPGAVSVGPLLMGLVLTLTLMGVRVTGTAAQAPEHVHSWTTYLPPDQGQHVYRSLWGDITAAEPARPCEVLVVEPTSNMDPDRCATPGCPIVDVDDGGTWTVTQWDDLGAKGKFGRIVNGVFEVDESPAASHYRVDRDEEPGNLSIRHQIANTNSTYAVDPAWWSEPTVIPVDGQPCPKDTTADIAPNQSSACAGCTQQPAFSSITPLHGNLSFSIPVTSWGYRGMEIPFSLTDNSRSVIDASLAHHQIHPPAALSDGAVTLGNANPKWAMSFAEWIQVLPGGHAVWNRGDGTQLSFEQVWNSETDGPYWRRADSFHTLTSPQGVELTSPPWEHEPGDSTLYQDLIVQKTEPAGKVVTYEYEPPGDRSTNAGWDGVLAWTSYVDNTVTPPVTHTITRAGQQLVYGPGHSYSYGYTGQKLASITHDSTGASVHWTYDQYGNPSGTRTGAEGLPLVGTAYTYGGDTGRRILTATTTDLLGHQTTTTFNGGPDPLEVKAFATPGSGLADQVTRLAYTGGKLTSITEAWGTGLADTTTLEYNHAGFPDLPSAVQDSLGGRTLLSYHAGGSPSSVSSPENLLAPVGDPDRSPSVSTTQLNGDELPSAVLDPLGHRVNISYNAEAAGSNRLVVTFTNVADGSTSTVTLDANGNVVRSVDEAGMVSTATYNRAGQPLQVRSAVGTAWERAVTYYYDTRGDLVAFDPPGGAAGRVYFEYVQYEQGGPPVKSWPEVYVGKLTRIIYPDGTNEFFGYNGQEELEWRMGGDALLTTLTRDELHRVKEISYPATTGYPGWTVTVTRDEFGRTTAVQDQNGLSTFTYDDLNRVVTANPAVGQTATYQYLKDLPLQRAIGEVTLAGVGTWEFREDGKGREAQVLNPLNQLTTRYFDPDSKLLREVKANGTYTDYAYTNRDWLGGIQHRLNGGGLLDTLSYFYTDGNGVYDPTGHIRREVDSLNRTHAFFYNPNYELTAEQHPDFGTIEYFLDPNGSKQPNR